MCTVLCKSVSFTNHCLLYATNLAIKSCISVVFTSVFAPSKKSPKVQEKHENANFALFVLGSTIKERIHENFCAVVRDGDPRCCMKIVVHENSCAFTIYSFTGD